MLASCGETSVLAVGTARVAGGGVFDGAAVIAWRWTMPIVQAVIVSSEQMIETRVALRMLFPPRNL